MGRCAAKKLACVVAALWIVQTAWSDPDAVTLYYWGNDLALENDVLVAQDLIQDFENRHDGSDGRPAIKVILGQSATFDRTSDPQRLLCAIAGGDPPDVVWFDRFAVGEWASRGAFVPLQPFLDEDLAQRPDDPFTMRPEQFYEACWAESVYKDTLYAIPDYTDNRALFYNQDLLEKHAAELIAAGCVDPKDPSKPGPPRTWEQLKAATRILTIFDGNGDLVRIGFLPHSPTFGNSWLYLYAWLNGGEFLSPDGSVCTLDSPKVVEALAFMTELYDIMGGAEKVIAFQTSAMGGDLDPFLSDKVAMKIDADYYLTDIANKRRDMRLGVALAPAPEGMRQLGWCGGHAFVIPRGAKHLPEAWEFIKYLSSQRAFEIKADAGKQLSRASGNVYIPSMSGRKDVTLWAMENYLYSDPTIAAKFKDAKRVFVDAMPFSRYRPVTPVGQLLWNEQVRGMEQGIYKRYDKQDILRNSQISLERSAAAVQADLNRVLHPVEYPTLSWSPIIVIYVLMLAGGTTCLYIYFNRRVQARGYFRREFYAGYLFASPWFIGFVIFGGGPIFFSFVMSFCQYDVMTPPKWVGLNNYSEMFFSDPLFYKSLYNTLFMALSIPITMVLGLGIAMLLAKETRGMATYRTIFYLPTIMPAVAAAILWTWIFNPQEGVLNSVLRSAGLPAPAWLQDVGLAKTALIMMMAWGAGGSMIIWLAGLKGIPQHLYEAAEMDGAGPIRRFWSITLPMLSPYILFNLIMGLIATFQVFTQAYVMTRGGPLDATLFYVYALFNNAFRYMKMGYASAMAWVLFAIVLILTLVQLRLSKLWVHYESEE
ncbi:MAG: extracellular solute-binding protein [Candidatus Hydrogenedentes bacterium]|nr:extracellular solute-binding protein [Candidatus Hydrogenedentota bacterium]